MTPNQLLLAGIGGLEVVAAVRRAGRRTELLEAATRRADALGRPLAVVSAANARDPHWPLADASAVVFVPDGFEGVEDIEAAWREAVRVAGAAEHVYVNTVAPWTLAASLAPGAHWSVAHAPPEGATLVANPVTRGQKLVAAAGVAALVWAALRDGDD